MNIRKIKLILLLMVGLLLTACFGSPASVPEDRFYTLKIATAKKVANKYQRIAINKIYAYGIYNERALLYASAELPLQIKRYHYHHWVMPPTRLIQHTLKNYLSHSGITNDVVVDAISTNTDLRISGQLLGFNRIIQPTKDAVHVELEFEVDWPDGRHHVFQYTQTIITKKNTLHAAAEAYGVALSTIFKAFLADLS